MELFRIRDRIRIRLNLLQYDFMSLESHIRHVQHKNVERKSKIDQLLNGEIVYDSDQE